MNTFYPIFECVIGGDAFESLLRDFEDPGNFVGGAFSARLQRHRKTIFYEPAKFQQY